MKTFHLMKTIVLVGLIAGASPSYADLLGGSANGALGGTLGGTLSGGSGSVDGALNGTLGGSLDADTGAIDNTRRNSTDRVGRTTNGARDAANTASERTHEKIDQTRDVAGTASAAVTGNASAATSGATGAVGTSGNSTGNASRAQGGLLTSGSSSGSTGVTKSAGPLLVNESAQHDAAMSGAIDDGATTLDATGSANAQGSVRRNPPAATQPAPAGVSATPAPAPSQSDRRGGQQP